VLRENRRSEYANCNLVIGSHAIRYRPDANPRARIYFLFAVSKVQFNRHTPGSRICCWKRHFGLKERERERQINTKMDSTELLTKQYWVMVLRRMRWAGHMASMGKREMHTGFWWVNLREWNQSENLEVDERLSGS